MSRRSQSLFLDLGLVGSAALIASVSLSLMIEPLIAADLFAPESPPDNEAFVEDNASLDDEARDRLAALTGLPLSTSSGVSITHTPAPSPLRFVVAGTVVGRNSPHAIAVLLDPSSRTSLIVRIGDLLEDAVVTAIERGRVIVRRDGRDEVLATGASTNAPRRTGPVENIRTLSAERVAVPRSVVDNVLVNIHTIASQAFFSPTFLDGKPAFRIDRIKQGSLFEQLGLQNSDVLVSIDDIPFDRMDALMTHYGQLGRAREVRVAFVRGGQIQRRTYEIGG